MNFPLYIAKRYLRSASKNNAINIINGITSVGIVVGAMALFIVLSVFSGLKDFSLSFSNDFDPDLKVIPSSGKSFVANPDQMKHIVAVKGVVACSRIIEERVLFLFDGKEQVTYIKGVDSLFYKVNPVKKSIYQGEWFESQTNQVVVGYGISQKLSLGLFDFNNPFEVYVPKSGKGTIENPESAFNKSKLAPVGIYAISEDLDSKFVFADLLLTQSLLEFKPDQISAIEIRLQPNADEESIKAHILKILNNKVIIKNRAQLNESLYKMLNTENIAFYLILTLVIIIAILNFIGSLIMIILDKKANLKTLYNLGTEVKDLRNIFFFQGTLLSVFGGIVGLTLGVLVVFIQQEFQLIMITPTLAYPVVFSIQNVIIVLGTIVSLGVLASWIASNSVTKKLLE
ncbi:MAG: ABC transporter permease [Bacteroidota bacterium]